MLRILSFLFLGLGLSASALALEVEGFLTSDCQRKTGLITHVSEDSVEFVGIDGSYQILSRGELETVYVFNVIENPFKSFNIDEAALKRLKSITLIDSDRTATLAFPVRFIEDLLIFYSVEGKSHVHTYDDIYQLRPSPASAQGIKEPKSYKKFDFDFTDQSARCTPPARGHDTLVKPTRVLADKISINEFLDSFQRGYEALDSFQERTYLYARPFLFEKKARLGLIIQGEREEPGINVPLFFQWSGGEPYRFQSFNVIGLSNQEFLPNTDPVWAIRSEVKSHAFHALFVGNVVGLPAGNKVFTNDFMKINGDLSVIPTFNYLAMMGGDFGPYSLSIGFYYPDFGIKVREQRREVLGASASYALRAMYTKDRIRLRGIGALTKYESGNPSDTDVIITNGDDVNQQVPSSYSFEGRFLRAGVDYQFSEQLKASVDGIWVNGNYKETYNSNSNDIRFNKVTTQFGLTQSFGNYVSLTGYCNLNRFDYKSNFLNVGLNDNNTETRFFGAFEFIF